MVKHLISRNLRIYFRDKTAVFFSLLSALIVIILYIVFLAKMQNDEITKRVGDIITPEAVTYLVHSWILGGLLSITTITSVLGGFGGMVLDRERSVIMDFKSAPIKAWVYPFSHIVAAFLIGVFISLIPLVIYPILIYLMTGYSLTVMQLAQGFGLILLSSLINSFAMGLVCSFFGTVGAFSMASIIIGTTVGFINGLYVPIGILSPTVQNVLAAFPSANVAKVFREVFTKDALATAFSGVPSIFGEEYKSIYGIVLKFSDKEISDTLSLAYAAVVGLVALCLMILNLQRKREEI
ncbi:MAG: ABC transporter permease [Clostridiales bacterium]|jgi:multidrug/hemolysin transport system permease protein|nr:ABC transporter permease [Clostridiales bacterium]